MTISSLFFSFFGFASSTTAPITLAEAKAYLRVDGTDQDDLITDLIATAAIAIEDGSGIVCKARSVSNLYRGFADRLPLRRGPVNSITSVTYRDANGAVQTLASDQYRLTDFAGAPVLVPAFNVTWPDTQAAVDAVTVTFNAGYTANNLANPSIRTAARQLVLHWFVNRDGQMSVPPMVASLLTSAGYQDIG